ncbi:MAG: type III polyketide synthase [Gemmatimonadales bacterium]|jgi:predicted naringenin-chalcone synthase|nr:MAG: type III polyketide synthase [Gemmatimonadales bacterium]
MSLTITGMGTSVPPRVALQAEAAELAPRFCQADRKQARILRALYRKSGVQQRHTVAVRGDSGPLEERIPYYPLARDSEDLGPTTRQRMAWYEQEAPPLAVEACRTALARAETSPSEITHLVTVSCTGFFSPGVDAALIDQLGLERAVERTHVGFMGCHGALNGLRAASAYALDPAARVLLCAVELCSLHFAYGWDPEMLVANTLFADGAAALVGRGGGGPGWRVRASGTFLMPDSVNAMTWRIGDHGFRMTLSPQVPERIRQHLADWLGSWLAHHGFGLDDVASWAVHPGGPRILDAVEASLELDPADLAVSREILRTHGNMSSPTVLFILERMMQQNRARPCVALAFGPGLVVEAALIV